MDNKYCEHCGRGEKPKFVVTFYAGADKFYAVSYGRPFNGGGWDSITHSGINKFDSREDAAEYIKQALIADNPYADRMGIEEI